MSNLQNHHFAPELPIFSHILPFCPKLGRKMIFLCNGCLKSFIHIWDTIGTLKRGLIYPNADYCVYSRIFSNEFWASCTVKNNKLLTYLYLNLMFLIIIPSSSFNLGAIWAFSDPIILFTDVSYFFMNIKIEAPPPTSYTDFFPQCTARNKVGQSLTKSDNLCFDL